MRVSLDSWKSREGGREGKREGGSEEMRGDEEGEGKETPNTHPGSNVSRMGAPPTSSLGPLALRWTLVGGG